MSNVKGIGERVWTCRNNEYLFKANGYVAQIRKEINRSIWRTDVYQINPWKDGECQHIRIFPKKKSLRSAQLQVERNVWFKEKSKPTKTEVNDFIEKRRQGSTKRQEYISKYCMDELWHNKQEDKEYGEV